jgi:excisionase family DNA binding protein
MARERRSHLSAEGRRTHARSELSDSGHHGRRIAPVWLTVAQLCRRWQLSRKTIYKFIDAKILPAWKVGDHLYRVAVEDVLRFEEQLPVLQSDGRVSFPAKD